jgi:hypothetical protein
MVFGAALGETGFNEAIRAEAGSIATTWRINSDGRGRVESDLSMKTKTHFAFRVDVWDDTGDSIRARRRG